MAEGEGFEPPLPFRVKRFSRPPVSTAHTSLRGWFEFIKADCLGHPDREFGDADGALSKNSQTIKIGD
jgi:hypothetical protein